MVGNSVDSAGRSSATAPPRAFEEPGTRATVNLNDGLNELVAGTNTIMAF